MSKETAFRRCHNYYLNDECCTYYNFLPTPIRKLIIILPINIFSVYVYLSINLLSLRIVTSIHQYTPIISLDNDLPLLDKPNFHFSTLHNDDSTLLVLGCIHYSMLLTILSIHFYHVDNATDNNGYFS